jgi:p-aminobenzoyl-glutamate transporter AbgT
MIDFIKWDFRDPPDSVMTFIVLLIICMLISEILTKISYMVSIALFRKEIVERRANEKI